MTRCHLLSDWFLSHFTSDIVHSEYRNSISKHAFFYQAFLSILHMNFKQYLNVEMGEPD